MKAINDDHHHRSTKWMVLGDLSPELIINIAKHIELKRCVNALARTCRDLYVILNPYLYRNNTYDESCSAVWWAAREARKGTLQHFKDAGLDLSKLNDCPGGSGNLFHTALRPYPRKKHSFARSETVRFIADSGVDVNAKSSDGHSPLILAACRGHDRTLLPLIDCGADVYARDTLNRECMTLMHAVIDGSVDVSLIQYLVDTYDFDINQRDSQGRTLLHHAAVNGEESIMDFLIARGVDVNAQDELGFAPAHLLMGDCPYVCPMQACKVLFENGADVNIQTRSGKTPLHFGTRRSRSVELMEYLIKKGADVNAASHVKGLTVIHRAVKAEALELLPLYVKYGGNINAQDAIGNTALHLLVLTRRMDDYKILTDLGADVNIRDYEGRNFHELREIRADQIRQGLDRFGNPLEDYQHVQLHMGLLSRLSAAYNS